MGNVQHTFKVVRLGRRRRNPLRDFYHWLMILRWWKLSFFVLATLLLSNVLFALLYLQIGDAIKNATPGSFSDAYFFSVQTMVTIGYGNWYPVGILANCVATVEGMLGLLGFAMAAGLMFAKFSRPTAKVLFSKVAVIGRRDGIPCLSFRMANERANQILEAHITVVLARDEVTLEGESIRRMYDLILQRSHSPNFALSWLAVHPIDPSSPIYGKTPEQLAAVKAEILITLSGIDDTFSQPVYARHSYTYRDLRWNHRFQDIFRREQNGVRYLDFNVFHDTLGMEGHEPLGVQVEGSAPPMNP
jgi:inward rectifier potassium channel